MMPLGLNLWALPSHGVRDHKSLEQDFAKIAAMGYQSLEATCGPDDRLRFGDAPHIAQNLVDAALSQGLGITALCSGATWDAPLNAKDAETRRVATEAVEQLIALASRLGENIVVLLTPGTTTMPGQVYSGVSSAEAWNRTLESLLPLTQRAADQGVRLALENSWTRFLNSPLEAKRFLEEAATASLGWYLDLGNAALLADPCDWIHTLGHHLMQVQAKDFSHTAEGGKLGVPGDGQLDYPRIAAALQQVGYRGPLNVEAPPDGKSAARAAKFLQTIPGLGLASKPEVRKVVHEPAAMPSQPVSKDAVKSSYRYAIVGLGNMGRHHAGYLLRHPRMKMSDVVDPTGKFVLGPRPTMKGVRRCRRILGLTLDRFPTADVRRHRDIQSLIDAPHPPDVVWLCTPTDLHASQIRLLHQAGIAVFCEKPLARTAQEAENLLHHDTPALFCGHVLRFWPQWNFLQERIHDQRFGKLHRLDLWRFSGRPQHAEAGWLHEQERSGGALLDLHVHEADFLLGMPWAPHHIAATLEEDADGLVQEVHAQYQYPEPDAPKVHARGGWLLPKGFPFLAGFRARFEQATLGMNDGPYHPDLWLYPETGGAQAIPFSGDAFQLQLDAIVDALDRGCVGADPRLDVSRGVEAIRLIERTLGSDREL
ncbi:MAG: TIM barrel protein [Planctomycetota bacterium]